MPDTQPSPQHSVVANDIAERDVMYLLTDPEGQRHWSEKEIGDEIEDPVGAPDVVRGAKERADEAKAEYEALKASAAERKKAITDHLDALL